MICKILKTLNYTWIINVAVVAIISAPPLTPRHLSGTYIQFVKRLVRP